jgi:putative flippase GtrA
MTSALPRQIGRYVAVGLVVVAIDYSVFAALFWAMPGQHLAANLAGKIIGACAGFILHKYISFAGQQRDGTGRQAFSYAALLAFNLIVSSGLLWLLVDALALNAYASRLCVDAVIIGTSFLGSKLWVYRAA